MMHDLLVMEAESFLRGLKICFTCAIFSSFLMVCKAGVICLLRKGICRCLLAFQVFFWIVFRMKRGIYASSVCSSRILLDDGKHLRKENPVLISKSSVAGLENPTGPFSFVFFSLVSGSFRDAFSVLVFLVINFSNTARRLS